MFPRPVRCAAGNNRGPALTRSLHKYNALDHVPPPSPKIFAWIIAPILYTYLNPRKPLWIHHLRNNGQLIFSKGSS